MIKNIKRKNGITLIALVITIIVLLILAGVSISMLSGDNSILGRAVDAKEKTTKAQKEESLKLAIAALMSKYYSGNPTQEFDEYVLANVEELRKETGASADELTVDSTNKQITYKGDVFAVSEDGDVTIVASATTTPGASTTTTPNPTATATSTASPTATSTPTATPTASPTQSGHSTVAQIINQNAGTVTMLSSNSVTTLIDTFGNEIKVPKGFGIATDSGTDVTQGIVIQDADSTRATYESQFVWIPVGTVKKDAQENTVNIALGRYDWDNNVLEQAASNYTSNVEIAACKEYASSSTTKINIAKDLSGFITSATNNGGYYLARYEAGIKGMTETTNSATTGAVSKNSTSPQIIIKKSVGVWNMIGQKNAALVCRDMYNTTNDAVNSDLINSYSWDTAVKYVSTFCGVNNYLTMKGVANNYEKTTAGDTILSATSSRDEYCKICDMIGNMQEFSTEMYYESGYEAVVRGGDYTSSTPSVTARYRTLSIRFR